MCDMPTSMLSGLTNDELLFSLKESACKTDPGLEQVLLSDPEEFPVFPYLRVFPDYPSRGYRCWALYVNKHGFGDWLQSMYDHGIELGYDEEELEHLREELFDSLIDPKGPEPHLITLVFTSTYIRETSDTAKVISLNHERIRRRR